MLNFSYPSDLLFETSEQFSLAYFVYPGNSWMRFINRVTLGQSTGNASINSKNVSILSICILAIQFKTIKKSKRSKMNGFDKGLFNPNHK
jgi:hypothetical protein